MWKEGEKECSQCVVLLLFCHQHGHQVEEHTARKPGHWDGHQGGQKDSTERPLCCFD